MKEWTMNYEDIINISCKEIIELKNKDIIQIEEYLNNEDISESSKITFTNDLISIKTEFNVLIDFWHVTFNDISLKEINKLILLSKELNMPLKVFIRGGDYKKDDIREKIDLLFNNSTLEKLKKLNEYLLNNTGREIIFIESDISSNNKWNLKQIIYAHERIQKVCDVILKFNLSPFETVAFIYKIITKSFAYKENEDDTGLARSIIGVLNTDNIVCVGYSLLIKAIIDKLDYPDLICDGTTIEVQIEDNLDNQFKDIINSGEGHMKNLIFIKDDKYEVDGVYLLDSTYDSKRPKFPNGLGFSNFMIPVTDLIEYKDCRIKQYDDSYDEFLGLFGIESNCPDIPPVISKYESKSSPIPYETLEKVISNTLKIIFYVEDEEKLKEKVENEMDWSMIFSKSLFKNTAKNSIRIEAEKYDFTFE